jgi:hypothetical protein
LILTTLARLSCFSNQTTKLRSDSAISGTEYQPPIEIVIFSLCTTLCLQWEPEIVAIAVMYLAVKLSKFEVKDWINRMPHHSNWWDQFVEDLEATDLEEICHQVLDLYMQVGFWASFINQGELHWILILQLLK